MKRILPCLLGACVTCLLSLSPARADKFHNKPEPDKYSGGISGQVLPAKELETVIVLEPTEYWTYQAQVDRRTGKFHIEGLPPGRYDLLVKCRTVLLEGIRLAVPPSYEKLSKEDLDGIKHVTWISDDYFNNKTIVRLGGNRGRVKLLIDQVRDKHTVEPSGRALAGILIRRLEICEMRKTGKIWTIKKTRHLYREEHKKSMPGATLKYIYVPKLGGIRVGRSVKNIPVVDLKKVKRQKFDYFYYFHHRAP